MENCSLSSILSAWKLWEFLEQHKGGFCNLQFWFNLEIIKSSFNGLGSEHCGPILHRARATLKYRLWPHPSVAQSRGKLARCRHTVTDVWDRDAPSLSSPPIKGGNGWRFFPLRHFLLSVEVSIATRSLLASCRFASPFGDSFRTADPHIIALLLP
jgi:hypothetical protein